MIHESFYFEPFAMQYLEIIWCLAKPMYNGFFQLGRRLVILLKQMKFISCHINFKLGPLDLRILQGPNVLVSDTLPSEVCSTTYVIYGT